MGDTITHPEVTGTEAAVTVYPWWDQVPAHMATKTQLAQEGLKPGKGVKPCAGIGYGRGRRERYYDLYDRAQAVPKRQPSAAQLAALEKAHLALRTCRGCGAVKERATQLITDSDLWASGRNGMRDILTGRGYCWQCEAKAESAVHALDRDEQILWARGLTARTDWCVLDTETADLYGAILEVAVVGADGATRFHSLVRPRGLEAMTVGDPDQGGERNAVEADEFQATRIHGIRPSDVAASPLFADVEAALRAAITGQTVVVYNLSYDLSVLESSISWMVPGEDASHFPEQRRRVKDWLDAATDWECAMIPYAAFAGDWSDYRRDYIYKPLDGGHRAEGDCREVLALIGRMAASPLTSEKTAETSETGMTA